MHATKQTLVAYQIQVTLSPEPFLGGLQSAVLQAEEEAAAAVVEAEEARLREGALQQEALESEYTTDSQRDHISRCAHCQTTLSKCDAVRQPEGPHPELEYTTDSQEDHISRCVHRQITLS